MIDGMIIIGTGKTYPDLAVALFMLGVVFLAFSLCGAVVEWQYRQDMDKRMLVLALLVAAISIYAIWYGVTRPPIRTVKAIMEPGVDFTEVARKYEVQTIDGQVWELVEKDEAALPDGDPGQ